ncbi:Protein of unknown function DUF115 [Lachnospiraceae bacterium KHCPX20]|nr:Protein of unknown function DUF115 [Lachnospiraceae bacterium KHCPX20]
MKKIAIWGAGVIGRRVADFFGSEYVACIIDGDKGKQGTSYHKMPIISFHQYLERSDRPIIIVSMMVVPDVVRELIHSEANIKSFDLADFPEYVFEVPRSVVFEKIKRKLEGQKEVYFIGKNPLSELFLEEYGCEFDIHFIEHAEPNTKVYSWMGNVAEGTKDNEVERIIDISVSDSAFLNLKIKEFKNIHKGKRAFIICNGPSLRWSDLDVLHEHNEICFGMNSIFQIFGSTAWRPNYYIETDPEIEIFDRDIVKSRDLLCPKFITDLFETNRCGSSTDYFVLHGWYAGKKARFSEDVSRVFFSSSTVTFACLQLAAYMGFSEIYLLGADCTNVTRHFSTIETDKNIADMETNDVYSEDFYEKQTKKWLEGYAVAREYAEERGIKIYNATRGGALEIYERVDFDSLFKNS